MRKRVVTALLGTALLCTGVAAISPAAATAAPGDYVEICAPSGCPVSHIVLKTEVDSNGTHFRRLYVCDDYAADGLSVTARVDFGTEVRSFADPTPENGDCQKHSFYVNIRKFRMTLGGSASPWAPPPAL